MRPFDLISAALGESVITRSGLRVVKVVDDVNCAEKPITAIFADGSFSIADVSGRHLGAVAESPFDLFMEGTNDQAVIV